MKKKPILNIEEIEKTLSYLGFFFLAFIGMLNFALITYLMVRVPTVPKLASIMAMGNVFISAIMFYQAYKSVEEKKENGRKRKK